jgi:hypothetical protein
LLFSQDNSVVGQAAHLADKVLWAFPPKSLVGEVLTEIEAAYWLDPSTRATFVIRLWPEISSFTVGSSCWGTA